MSDAQEIFANVLLPTAQVALFVLDKDIREAVQSLKEDWRFARVTFDVRDGDVDSAIEAYKGNTSPNLVIVETPEIGETFTGRLEVLAESCSEGTAAVVVGPVNDVYLYRKLIDMGVSDYLVRPVGKSVLSEVIAKILIEKLGAPGSRLIAYVGSKGGVGTSSIAEVSAFVLAGELQEKTVILDAAGGQSYLSVAMGTDVVTTLHEAARACGSTDQDSFKRMVVRVGENLSVLATGAESVLDDMVSAEQFESILNKLMVSYPVVIVDLSGAPVSIMRSVVTRAHDVVVVTSPTLPSLRSARGLLQEIRTVRGGVDQGIHLVLNQKGASQGFEVSDSDVVEALKISPSLVMNWQPKIFAAVEHSGKPFPEVSGAKDIFSPVQKFLTSALRFSSSALSGKDENQGKGSLLGDLLGKIKPK